MIDSDPRPSLDILPEERSGAPFGQPAPDQGFQSFVPTSGRTMHLRDYLKILSKRRWLAGSVFTVIVLGTAVYNYTATSIYQARVKLLIEAGEPNYISFKEVVEQPTANTDYYQTQYDLLKSRSLAHKTVETLQLTNGMPSIQSQTVTGSFRKLGSEFLGLFRNRDAKPRPSVQPPAIDAVRESRAVDSLLATIQVQPVRNSRIVNLLVESPDPELATRVVNAHARGYIEQNTEFKFLTAKEATDWLGARLQEARKQVEDADAAVQRYREQHDVIPVEDSENITVQRLTQLSAALTTAKTTRLTKEAIYTQLKAIQNDPAALDSFPEIQHNSSIQAKRDQLVTLRHTEQDMVNVRQLGPTHPELVAVRKNIATLEGQVQSEIANVIRGVRTDYENALGQERNLAEALETQNREALAMSKEAIQFGVLKRDAESTRQVYQDLLQQAKQTGVSNQLRITNVRVVDFAEVPRSPVRPDRRFNMTIGFASGLAIALGLAFFFEYLDNRIKTPDEIKVHLGLPPLGLLPIVRNAESRSGYPLLTDAHSTKLVEAFRTLRTNILFSSAEPGSRSLMITSTGPNEGKTLVAGNLAISLAEAGQRVLLIDADMRRPKQHDLFGLTSEPGLSDLLVGTAKASESVRKANVQGLWLLPSGKIPPNPAELLGSHRFDDFLRSLREHFDWVLIDTPPVMAVADASIVAHKATGVVFVVGAEMVSRQAAGTALEQLENARAKLIGGVLNRVDLDRHSYYYSQYYRKEYAEYYTRPAS